MRCPKCKDMELDASEMPGARSAGRKALSCSRCGGMWIGDLDLAKMCDLHGRVDAESEVPESAGKSNPASDSRTGLCPLGHGLLIRAKVELDPPFYLEKCSACRGIWFDKGELDRIVENNICDNLSVIWTQAWQRKQKRKKGREYYLDVNRKLLGDEVFDAVMELARMLRDHPEQLRALSLSLHSEIKETKR